MERLTMRGNSGIWCAEGSVGRDDKGRVSTEALDRLASYEDTGLTPEEIKNLQLEVATLKTIEKMYDGLGRPDHLRELTQAEQDGRLVVLPDVPEKDRQSFIEDLKELFDDLSNYDPSVGIFGWSEGESRLAKALMDVLTRQEAEEALGVC